MGLKTRHWDRLGNGGLTFTELGFGTAPLGNLYKAISDEDARATLDAMALQNVDILLAMEKDLGKRMKPLRVDGGAAANDLLMQVQADYLGRKLVRPKVLETTVAGASYLAGLGVGLWGGQGELKSIWQRERDFAVSIGAAKRRERLAAWHAAVQRTLVAPAAS